LEEVGVAFLYAPAYHSTFAAAAPARKKLAAEGQRTVFNLLGPLLNPARPDARLVGVFRPEHVALYRDALEAMGCRKFTVACGRDEKSGTLIGEVSAWGSTLIGGTLVADGGAAIQEMDRKPDLPPHETLDALLVRNADESASRLETILSGESQGLDRETLLVNAAVAAWTHGTATSLDDGLGRAREALDSGKALAQLRKWQKFSEK
jgi:anthranilate phosphoribosyltransferase